MIPEPDCTEVSRWPKNNEPDDSDRANTCTTDGDTFLKSSIVACSLAARFPLGVTVRGVEAENHRAVRYGSDTQKVASSKSHTIAKRRKRMGTSSLLADGRPAQAAYLRLVPAVRPCVANGRELHKFPIPLSNRNRDVQTRLANAGSPEMTHEQPARRHFVQTQKAIASRHDG